MHYYEEIVFARLINFELVLHFRQFKFVEVNYFIVFWPTFHANFGDLGIIVLAFFRFIYGYLGLVYHSNISNIM